MSPYKVVLEREVTQVCETIIEADNETEAAAEAVHAADGPWWCTLQVLHLEAVDLCECEWVPLGRHPDDDDDPDVSIVTHIPDKALG